MPYYLVRANIQNRADVITATCPGFPSIEKLDAFHSLEGWYAKPEDTNFRYFQGNKTVYVAMIRRMGNYNPLTREYDDDYNKE